MTLATVSLYTLVALVCFALVCRASHMDKSTALAIVWQYRLLFVGVIIAPSLPVEWVAVSVLSGVLGQLLVSSVGWRDADIQRKPAETSPRAAAWAPTVNERPIEL